MREFTENGLERQSDCKAESKEHGRIVLRSQTIRKGGRTASVCRMIPYLQMQRVESKTYPVSMRQNRSFV